MYRVEEYMMEKLLSVIVPVYNREKTIKKCLDSICNQKFDNFEIIVVDDGSTDNTADIIKGIQKTNVNLRYYYINNEGAFNARKYGVSKALGKYVTFVDSDDWVEDTIYTSFNDAIIKDIDFISYGLMFNKDVNRPYEGNLLLNSIEEGYYYSNKTFLNKMIYDISSGKAGINQSLCTKIIKKKIVESAMSSVTKKLTFGDDAIVVFGAALKAESFCFSNQHKYHYVCGNESITSTVSIETFNDILNFKDEMELLVNSVKCEVDFNAQIARYLQHIINHSISKMFNIQILQSCRFDIDFLKDKKVLIYGAGEYGEKLYRVVSSEPSINVLGWIDRFKNGSVIRGVVIDSLDNISSYDYDILIVAVKDEEFFKKIKLQLMKKNLDESKISWIKPEICLDTFYYNI